MYLSSDLMPDFSEVDALGLQQLLQNETDALKLVDVRTPAEVARGSIPGAHNIPLHMLPLALEELEPTQAIIFYCQSGGRSAQACAFMAARGFKNIYNLRGGIMGWVQTGLATGSAQG